MVELKGHCCDVPVKNINHLNLVTFPHERDGKRTIACVLICRRCKRSGTKLSFEVNDDGTVKRRD